MALRLRESICQSQKLPRESDVLIHRAELLAPEDRALVEAILVRGQTAESVSRLTGQSSRTICNRIRKIARRLASRKFIYAARALPYLSDEDAILARRHFCAGVSLRRLACEMDSSEYAIRRKLNQLAAQIDLIRRLNSGGPIGSMDFDRLSKIWKDRSRPSFRTH